jgi:GrpB-like predicted nucleotidyltransferase (UPF0157 family)
MTLREVAHRTDTINRYSELKQKLAVANPDDIAAYMDGKDEFVKEMEAKALVWVNTVGKA